MTEREDFNFASLTPSQLSQLESAEKIINSGSNDEIIVLAFRKS